MRMARSGLDGAPRVLRSVGRSARLFGCVCLYLLLSPSLGTSQTTTGVLVDGSSGLPIEGAMVWLVDQNGIDLPARLTDAQGRFFLRAPLAGRYHLAADRIGYEAVSSEPFDLTDGSTVEYRLSTQTRAFSLEGMTVETEAGQRCRVGPAEGAATAKLWYEARTALGTAVITEREALLDVRLERWERLLEPRSLTVREDSRETVEGASENPIRSRSAEYLRDNGFIQETPEGDHLYFVPDADVLLSDAFLDQHCFSVEIGENEEEGLVGLAFRPIPGQTLPDVEGVLWLDGTTAELRYLEVDYTRQPYEVRTGDLGARVEFEGLPNGSWVIRRWWLRIPQVGIERYGGLARDVEERLALTGVIEVGGELTDIRVRGQAVEALSTGRATIEGIVVDSIDVPGLAGIAESIPGAIVYVEGTGFSARSDAEGRFTIEGLPPGSYRIGVDHPLVRARAVAPPTWPAELRGGLTTDFALTLPTAESIRTDLCPSQAPGAAVVTGRVLEDETREPAAGASVEIGWEFPVGLMNWSGVRRDFSTQMILTTDSTGAYFACDVPAPASVWVRPIVGGQRGAITQVDVGKGQVVTQDLGAGARARYLHAAEWRSPSRPQPSNPGEGEIRGTLREVRSGRPMTDGAVELWTPEGELVAQTVADDRGFFRLPVRVAGTYEVRSWRIDADTVSDGPLTLSESEAYELDFLLEIDPIEVAGVEVSVEQRRQRLEEIGFYQRARISTGTFMTPEEIRSGLSISVIDVLERMPEVQVQHRVGPGQPGVMLRTGVAMENRMKVGNSQARCLPVIHLDGVPVQHGGNAPPFDLRSIPVEAIAGIEVYERPSQVPAQFTGISAACGVIVIWTR